MRIMFSIWLFATFSCVAVETNINYAAIAAGEDAPGLVLSNETNSLKSGLWINNPNHVIIVQNDKVVSEASLAMFNMSSNDVHFWSFCTPFELGYEIKMVDVHGRVVPKTTYGEMFGRISSQNPDGVEVLYRGRLGICENMLLGNGDKLYSGAINDPVKDIPKCFVLDKAGQYQFTLIHHVYVTEPRNNDYVFKRVTFSPVTVGVIVEKVAK
jgi:hypothetical protein